MWTSEWCAYNIVIPAISPYDDKKYSIVLREKFCWTLPRYYSIPIFDKSSNENERKFIYNYVSDVRSAMRTYFFPGRYYDTLIKMINVSGCIMSLLENQNIVAMQLVLFILNSLSENISGIKKLQLEKILNRK